MKRKESPTLFGFPIVVHAPCADPACALCAHGALVVFGDPTAPRQAVVITDTGFTANVIEGDKY